MAPKKAAKGAAVEADPLPGPSDEVEEEGEDTATFTVEIRGVSNLPCELETKVAVTGLCAEFRSQPTAPSASPSEFVFDKCTFIRRRAQQLYDALVSEELQVTLRNSLNFEVIGSVSLSLLPLLHGQLEVGGEINLELTKLYQVRWLPEAEGAEQEKLETLEPPPQDQMPKSSISVFVRVENLVGPLEDREQWTTLSMCVGGVFALPQRLAGAGEVESHPFTHAAVFLGENVSPGALTKSAEEQQEEGDEETSLEEKLALQERFGLSVRFPGCERRVVYRGSRFISDWREMLNKVGGAWFYFNTAEKPSSDPKKPNPPELGALAQRFHGRAWVDLSALIRPGTRNTGELRCPLRSIEPQVPSEEPGSSFEDANTFVRVSVALSHDTKLPPPAATLTPLQQLWPKLGEEKFPSSADAVSLYRDAVERSFRGVAEVLNTSTSPTGGVQFSVDQLNKAGTYAEIKKDLRNALVQVCRERLRKDTSVIPGRPLEGAVRDEFMASAHSYLKGEMIDVIDTIRARVPGAASNAQPASPCSPTKSSDIEGPTRRASFSGKVKDRDRFQTPNGSLDIFTERDACSAAPVGVDNETDPARAALEESEGARRSRDALGGISNMGSRLERLAFEAELTGKWDRAATFLQSRLVLPEFKCDPGAWLAYGKLCARSRGRQMAAEEALLQAARYSTGADASSTEVKEEVDLMLAALLMDRGRLVEARQRLWNLHEFDFSNPMYRFFLGLCLFLSDEGQAAKVFFESSGKPRDWFVGLADQAAVAAKLKANQGSPDVAAYAACVEKLLEFGLPQLVFTFLDQSNTLSKEALDREPMAHLDARASAMEMDYSAALARLDRLIAGGQASRNAYRLAGDCHYHLQDYDRALQMMNKALSFEEPLDDAAFHARLGHVLVKKKRWKQAREAFLRSISLAPTAEAWYGVSYAEYRSEEFKTCYEALCEAELLDNERPDVWAQLTLVHLRLENWENADRCFAQCLAFDPDCDEQLLEVSAEYVKRETKPALAEAAARCALKVRDSGQGHAALADALALSGQTAQAVTESQCAIRFLVDSPEQRKAIVERATRWCEELDPSFADELEATRRQADQQFMQRLSAGEHH
jgi:tetratricopeptide (TPR) repeat protein